MTEKPALLDTSVFIATESGRPLDLDAVPTTTTAVCVVTLAELQVGVLAAADVATRALRLATLDALSGFDPLPITPTAARHWAEMRVRLAGMGRRVTVNDLWIAAVAKANDMAVVTQDRDYDPIEAAGGPPIIRV